MNATTTTISELREELDAVAHAITCLNFGRELTPYEMLWAGIAKSNRREVQYARLERRYAKLEDAIDALREGRQ